MAVPRILVAVAASDTAVGRAVRWATEAPVNHAFLLYEDALWGGWWAAQIGPEGVVKLPAGRVTAAYEALECYEYLPHGLEEGLRACRHMVGERYDWLGVAGFAAKALLWRVSGRRIANPVHAQHREFCSEFVASVLRAANAEGFRGCTPANLSPGDVRALLVSVPYFVRREWPVP